MLDRFHNLLFKFNLCSYMTGDADLGNPHMCFDSKREIQAGTDPLQRLPNFRKYCDPLVKHGFLLMTITRLSNGLKMVGTDG
jgi:hypothetical protein